MYCRIFSDGKMRQAFGSVLNTLRRAILVSSVNYMKAVANACDSAL